MFRKTFVIEVVIFFFFGSEGEMQGLFCKTIIVLLTYEEVFIYLNITNLNHC